MNIRLAPSTTLFILLILLLAALGAANVYLPQGALPGMASGAQLPASRPVMAAASAGIILVVYGGLGLLGLLLARRLGFPDLLDPAVSDRQRYLLPAVLGAACGLFFILADLVFQTLHGMGQLPHPPFPTSLTASLSAGIGEEVVFRLFFISFWVWMVSGLILRGRAQTPVFWVVALLSALAFGAGHLPAVMYAFNLASMQAIPPALLGEIFLLNGVLSLLAAYLLRKYGFLAAVGVHFWADIVWHVIWGLLA